MPLYDARDAVLLPRVQVPFGVEFGIILKLTSG